MDSVSLSISEFSFNSNVTHTSCQTTDVGNEEYFTKESAGSPVDLECHIQAERITKTLDRALLKTKLVLCLPYLIREQKHLTKWLSPQHLQELMIIFDQYDNPLFSTSLVNMAAIEAVKNGDFELKHHLNPELAHLLHIFNYFDEDFQNTIDLMIDNMRKAAKDFSYKKGAAADLTDARLSIITRAIFGAKGSKYIIQVPPGFEYLLKLEQLRDLMVERMNTTAAEDLKARHDTKTLEESNRVLEAKIEEYRETMTKTNMKFEETMKEKKDIISKLEVELESLQRASEVARNKKVLDSERQMVLLTRSHEARSEMLKEMEVEAREIHERQLKKNVHDETNNRQRRSKVETQLQSWIQKYDTDMREKQNEMDEMIRLYKLEVDLVDKLDKQLEEQQKEFVPLMEEKEREYHQEMEEKMRLFQEEHAARVLQVAWREVLANRAEKSKLRKLLKQQQAAAERAQRIAEAEAKKAAAEAKKAAAQAKKAAKQAALEAPKERRES